MQPDHYLDYWVLHAKTKGRHWQGLNQVPDLLAEEASKWTLALELDAVSRRLPAADANMVLSQDEDAPDVAGLHEVDGHDPLITEPYLHHSGEEETMKIMWHAKVHKGANKASFSKLN